MSKKFQPLDYSRGWDDYWRDHPQGYSPQEQMVNWSGQLNEMIDYLNRYFGIDMGPYVQNILEQWEREGKIGPLINQALFQGKSDRDDVVIRFADRGFVSDGLTDNSQRFNDLLSGLDPDKTHEIYVTPGTYLLAHPVQLPRNVTISGDKENSVLLFDQGAQLQLNFNTCIKDITLKASDPYSGDLVYMDNSVVTVGATFARVLVENVNIIKNYVPGYNSKAIRLYAQDNISPDTHWGYYGLTFSKINIEGFETGIEIHIKDGWINSNVFDEIHMRACRFGINLIGEGTQEVYGNWRIERNRFSNIIFQASEGITERFGYQTRGFPNVFNGIDLWDFTRWGYVDIGNIYLSDVYTSSLHFGAPYVFGKHFVEDRWYKVAKVLPITQVTHSIIFKYVYGRSEILEVMITNAGVNVTKPTTLDLDVDVVKDENGDYWMQFSKTSYGTMYVMEAHNMMANVYDLGRGTPTNPTPVTKFSYVTQYFSEQTATLYPEVTGEVKLVASANLITITGNVDNTNRLSDHFATIPPFYRPTFDLGNNSSTDIEVSTDGNIRTKRREPFSFTISFAK